MASASVVASFGAPGLSIRRHLFADPTLDVDLAGRDVVVTGASRGLGRATVELLATRGASVTLVARDEVRLASTKAALVARGVDAGRLSIERADLSSLAEVRALAGRLSERLRKIDVLVHNAGVLPLERVTTSEGLDAAFATNVLSGFLLTAKLEPLLAAAGHARVVHVSSGGMYLAKLDLDVLEGRVARYDGVSAYAQTKRAQVILSETWAVRLAAIGATSNAMHPGWAATEGVARSLPGFHRVMGPWLRSPEAGADTIAWLAASPEVAAVTGRLFFDRAARATDWLPWTRVTEPERRALFARCAELTSVDTRSDDAR